MARVEIRSILNGPNLILVDGKAAGEFCRCGHSNEKPFCDGSHQRVGFKAPAAVTVIVEE